MDDLIKIVGCLGKTGPLINGATETKNREIKKQECRFIVSMTAPMATSLIAPLAHSLIQTFSLKNAITGKLVMREGKGKEDGTISLLALCLMMKVSGKGAKKIGK